jgi:hypothetical protein
MMRISHWFLQKENLARRQVGFHLPERIAGKLP